MKYALDVAFLDHENRVIKIFRNFPPNRTTGSVSKAHAAIEGPSGVFNGITEGDHLDVKADFPLDGVMKGVQRILHWPVNIFLALLWSNFIFAAYHRWTAGGEINIGLVMVNTLFMVFFLTRRESLKTASRFLDWFIPIATVVFSLTLRPYPAGNDLLSGISSIIQSLGILGIIVSLLSLGRSFGIIPANRNVKRNGAYRFIRHPLYAGEIIFFLGFLTGNLNIYNTFAVLAVIAAHFWRMGAEEELLSSDELYREYSGHVRYRLIPGVY